MKKIILLIYFICFYLNLNAQTWQKSYTDIKSPTAICNDFTGGSMILNSQYESGSNIIIITNIDEKGIVRWSKKFPNLLHNISYPYEAHNYPSIIPTSDGNFILSIPALIIPNTLNNFGLVKMDKNGKIIWEKVLNPYGRVIIRSFNKELYLTGYDDIAYKHLFLKLNENGDTLKKVNFVLPFSQSQYEYVEDFFVKNTNELVFISSVYLCNFNVNGQTARLAGGEIFQSIPIKKNKEGDFYCWEGSTSGGIAKWNNNGQRVWINPDFRNKAIGGIAVGNDDGVVGIASNFGSDSTVRIFKIDKFGKTKWVQNFSFNGACYFTKLIKDPFGGFLIGGFASNLGTILLKIDENGNNNPYYIDGIVDRDMNKNCLKDSTDLPCKSCLVEIQDSSNKITEVTTNEAGRYSLSLDSGIYKINAYPLTNKSNWKNCKNLPPVTLNKLKLNEKIDFSISPNAIIPVMKIDVSTPLLRRCFTNVYSIKYCNEGSRKADNAYVTITIDSLLEFLGSSIPLTSRNGRNYRFNVGNIAIDDCNTFDITTRVRCGDSTRIGQTLCLEARIYPDTTLNNWNGANITVSGNCKKDSIEYIVKNTGGLESSILERYLIENDKYKSKKSIRIPVNGTYSEKFLANGNTWRLIVSQEPNHPTSKNPTAFVEGCGNKNTILNGLNFVTHFANDDDALALDIDCQAIIGAFDPNDKQGYPLGYDDTHKIDANQDIEYKIRFQNTGNDTAFNIVIRDTISEKLDISSIEFGVGSHSYKAEIFPNRSLKFSFENILLVDSFKNEPKSHGFVKYKIKQKKNLPIGTNITNEASIYFDFNEPIVTNKTSHIISIKDVLNDISTTNNLKFSMTIAPNPFSGVTTLDIPIDIIGMLEIVDINGRVVKNLPINGKQFILESKDLVSGIYFAKLLEKGQIVAASKFVVNK
jgi:uncharacterized repeat protein (TIGR01451 family)